MKPPARVLLYDVEIFPGLGYTWGRYEQTVIKFERETMVCSVAWKWLGSKQTFCRILPDYPTYRRRPFDNRMLIREFSRELAKADITIAHNGDRYDDRVVNGDMWKLGIRPTRPRFTIDTLKIARRRFRLSSNRLSDLAEMLGVGKKISHPGFEMWDGCMKGDRASWRLMRKYNKHDVDPLLEGVYEKMRPWISNHPDLSNWTRIRSCPACESKRQESRGWHYTQQGRRPRYMCRDCGKWSLGRYERDPKYDM